MIGYILASNENKYNFGKKLLNEIQNLFVIPYEYGINIYTIIDDADVFVAIIDNDYLKYNNIYKDDLKIIRHEIERNKRKLLVPIIMTKKANALSKSLPRNMQPIINYNSNENKLKADVREKIQGWISRRKEDDEKGKERDKTKHKNDPEQNIKRAICALFIAGVLPALFVMVYFLIKGKMFIDEKIIITMGIICLIDFELCCVVRIILFFSRYFKLMKKGEKDEYSSRIKKEINAENDRQSVNSELSLNNNNSDNTALGIMKINLEDIKEFYTWSQKQARSAFWLAVCMCVLGFVLICFAVINLKTGNGNSTPIISAIGGVITELIAGTSLFVYRQSLSQLNHYHTSLHEDERFLSMVNLVNMYNDKNDRDKILSEIINSAIKMNLSEKKDDTKKASDSSESKDETKKASQVNTTVNVGS